MDIWDECEDTPGRDHVGLAIEARQWPSLLPSPSPGWAIRGGKLRWVRDRSVASSGKAFVGELAAGSRRPDWLGGGDVL